MSLMTNEEITAEFEELFGSGSEDTEEPTEENQTTEEEPEEETTTEETSEEETGDEEGSEDSSEDESEEEQKKSNLDQASQSKQNHAFAQQRLQIKEQEKFIRSLGKLVGFDENASTEDIQAKIKEALIEKEAKENGISVELAQRLDRAEALLQENDRIKLEKKVTEEFSDLIEKHNLDRQGVEDFTQYLIDNDKNPMEGKEVDLEAEYLKLHFQEMIDSAVSEALAKEEARRKKVEESAPSEAPGGAKDKGEAKISTVQELDDLFNSMDL